jgi:hypothetical protein
MSPQTLVQESAALCSATLTDIETEMQTALANALNNGARLAVLVDVIPEPSIQVVLIEPDSGAVLTVVEMHLRKCLAN